MHHLRHGIPALIKLFPSSEEDPCDLLQRSDNSLIDGGGVQRMRLRTNNRNERHILVIGHTVSVRLRLQTVGRGSWQLTPCTAYLPTKLSALATV